MAGLSDYLTDKPKNKVTSSFSAALVVKLLNALEDTNYSYLRRHKADTEFHVVWKVVQDTLTDDAAIYSETLKFWKKLFNCICTSRGDFASFYNVFQETIDDLKEQNSTAINDDVFLRALVYSLLQMPDDIDVLRDLLKESTTGETVFDVMERLKETFSSSVGDDIASASSLKSRRGSKMEQPIPKKQKVPPPPPKAKLPEDLGEVLPKHFYTQLGAWFKVASVRPDPATWTDKDKRIMKDVKEQMGKHATHSKEHKAQAQKLKDTSAKLTQTRRRLEIYEPSGSGSQYQDGQQNDSANSRRGQLADHNPMAPGRGRGRGQYGQNPYNNRNQYGGPFGRW